MFPLEVYSLFINDLYIRIRREVSKKYDSRKHRDRNEYCRYQATKGKIMHRKCRDVFSEDISKIHDQDIRQVHKMSLILSLFPVYLN